MYTIYIVAGLLLLGLAVYLALQYSIRKSVDKVKKPPAVIDEGMVQCFSCGMVVEKEKALEKKGRYFCGVKRNDRNGQPIEQGMGDG